MTNEKQDLPRSDLINPDIAANRYHEDIPN